MSYDEDISINPIFKRIVTRFPKLIEEAPAKSLLVCVPKSAIAKEIYSDLQDGELLNYVLKPSTSSPLPGVDLYSTLTKKRVEVRGNSLLLRQGFSEERTVRVLFEETFYNPDDKSYPVLCVDQPFEGKSTSQVILQPEQLLDPQECFRFLLTGSEINEVNLESFLRIQLSNRSNLARFRQGVSLRHMLDIVSDVITKLVRDCLRYSQVHKKYRDDKSYIDILRLAVENVVHFEIYPKLFKVVCGLVSREDGELNKVTRNLAHIEASDLDIKSQFCFNFPKAKRELSRMNSLHTPYQKLSCLHQTFQILSQPTPHSNEALNADDLLPLLVLLIIHSDIPCWYGNLSFMENFYLSPIDKERHKYCISSVEAALEFLRSGNLKVDRSKKCWLIQNEGSPLARRRSPSSDYSINDFFELIIQENVSKLQESLDSAQNSHLKKLCHPLCTCDRCQTHLNSSQRSLGAATLRSCDDWGRTPLHVAALVGNETVVELLLNYGAQPSSQDYHGSSPLHMACQRGHLRVSMLLVDRGAPTNLQDNEGNTPLHLACLYGHEGCVKALIFQSPARKLNPYNEKGDTPLHIAARWGYEDIVLLLLEFGASTEARNKEKNVPEDCAHNSAIQTVFKDFILRSNDVGILSRRDSIIKMRHPLLMRSNTFDYSPMAFRRSNNMSRTVTTLQLKNNHLMEKEMSLVFDAITLGKERTVRDLLGWSEEKEMSDSGLSSDLSDTVSNGSCHPLCKCKRCSSVLITETPLNVSMASKSGQTFLHMACQHGNYPLAKLFITKGADINAHTHTLKLTPLHLAAQYNHADVVKLLIESGSDLNPRDVNGSTPLHYCATNGHRESAECLLQHGASPNEANVRENIPLHNASKWGHGVMVECLLEHGSHVDKHNADSLVPIQVTQSDEVFTILENPTVSGKHSGTRSNSQTSNLNAELDTASSSTSLLGSSSSRHDIMQPSPDESASEHLSSVYSSLMKIDKLSINRIKSDAEVGTSLLSANAPTILT